MIKQLPGLDLIYITEGNTPGFAAKAILENTVARRTGSQKDIELTRAGEIGKGFAVVAEQIRKLASQFTKSTADIVTLISSIQENMKQAEKASEVVAVQSEKNTQIAETADNIASMAKNQENVVTQFIIYKND